MGTPALSIPDFANLIRSKNPGAYNDIADNDLAQKVLAKYPQYSDMVAGAYQTRPGAPVQNVRDTGGQQTNYAGLQEIVPKEGETFEDTMRRAIEYGKTVTPDQLHQQAHADLKVAPAVALAAPAIGAAGAGGIAGTASLATLLGAPSAAAGTVGTGILDQAGNEIMRNVTTYGPSLLKEYGAKAALPLFRYAMHGAGMGAGYKVLDWIGKQLK
jgi:hypothetical protein